MVDLVNKQELRYEKAGNAIAGLPITYGASGAIEQQISVACGRSMVFLSIVEVTELAPVEVLLGLLLGGLSIRWSMEGGFYGTMMITYLSDDRALC